MYRTYAYSLYFYFKEYKEMLECISPLEIFLENLSWPIPLIEIGEMHSSRPRL